VTLLSIKNDLKAKRKNNSGKKKRLTI
jgi:hypothetical protein